MSRILQSKMKEGLEITVVSNRQQLDSIMKAWEGLQKAEVSPIPDVDPYLYVCELESLGPHVEPYILCLNRDGQLEAMLIGRLQKINMPIRLGYLTIMKPRLGEILVYHGGILGGQTKEVCSLLLRALRECLSKGEADVAVFNHFHCDSVVYHVVRDETPLLSQGQSPRVDGHWKMDIPKCINEFYGRKSHKSRYKLQRIIRKLEQTHKVYVKTYGGEDSLEEGISVAASLSSKTYQHALDGGFLDNPQMRSYLLLAARRGWLRIYILYINNEPAAFEWGIEYGGTFFLRTLGFDPKWSDWSVGTVLFLKVLEILCEEGNVNHMDFGFGDAEYKKIYGNTRTDTRSITIWADRLYPRFLNFMRTVIVGVWMAASYMANKLGLERKIKRIWRDRLSRKAATKGEESTQAGAGDLDDSVQ